MCQWLVTMHLCHPQVNNAALNNQMRDAEGREALLRFVEDKGGLFDTINVATCLNR